MAKMPPKPSELRTSVKIMREMPRPSHIQRDDWERLPRVQREKVICRRKARKIARAGTDALVADGVDGVRRYDCVMRHVHGMLSTDWIETSDGRTFAIEGPPDNWEGRNQWTVCTAVFNEAKQVADA